MNDCGLNTCRYNENGKCTNEEKRKECVEVSRKVLCIGENKLETVDDFQELAKKYGMTMYCVCGKSEHPVYVAKTLEEALEFIKTHNQHIELRIVVAN